MRAQLGGFLVRPGKGWLGIAPGLKDSELYGSAPCCAVLDECHGQSSNLKWTNVQRQRFESDQEGSGGMANGGGEGREHSRSRGQEEAGG